MNGIDTMQLVLAFVAGALLGAGYFAGLWLTVRHMQKISSPYRLYGLSLLLRLSLALGGLYLLAVRGTAVLLVGGVGFITARQLWLLGTRGVATQPVKQLSKRRDGDA